MDRDIRVRLGNDAPTSHHPARVGERWWRATTPRQAPIARRGLRGRGGERPLCSLGRSPDECREADCGRSTLTRHEAVSIGQTSNGRGLLAREGVSGVAVIMAWPLLIGCRCWRDGAAASQVMCSAKSCSRDGQGLSWRHRQTPQRAPDSNMGEHPIGIVLPRTLRFRRSLGRVGQRVSCPALVYSSSSTTI